MSILSHDVMDADRWLMGAGIPMSLSDVGDSCSLMKDGRVLF